MYSYPTISIKWHEQDKNTDGERQRGEKDGLRASGGLWMSGGRTDEKTVR